MKVLVVGKEGQVAKSLAQVRKPEGLELATIGRPEIDLTLPATVLSALERFAPNLVVNAAAYTAVDQAEIEHNLAHAINSVAPGVLAEACSSADIPMIHLSTDYVFDGTKSTPYSEDDLVAPLGVYGRSKLEGERRVAAGCDRHIILRTAWIVSAHSHNFAKTMLRLATTRSTIDVVDDQWGNPTYAPHLAVAILTIAWSILVDRSARWGVYHAAGSGEATWCDLAREVFVNSARIGGPAAQVRPIAKTHYPTRARRPANSRLDCSKLARTFGVQLPDWRVGVTECVLLLSQGATRPCTQPG